MMDYAGKRSLPIALLTVAISCGLSLGITILCCESAHCEEVSQPAPAEHGCDSDHHHHTVVEVREYLPGGQGRSWKQTNHLRGVARQVASNELLTRNARSCGSRDTTPAKQSGRQLLALHSILIV